MITLPPMPQTAEDFDRWFVECDAIERDHIERAERHTQWGFVTDTDEGVPE